jgi:hypothetical protein
LYPIELAEFSLSFAGKDAKQFVDVWDHPDEIPIEILLSWAGDEPTVTGQVLMVNAPFTIEVDKAAPVPGATQPGAGLQND